MKASWLLLLLLAGACSKPPAPVRAGTNEKVGRAEKSAVPTATAPVGLTGDALIRALDQLSVDAGDGWKDAIDRVVAVAGLPRSVSATALTWYQLEDATTCSRLLLEAGDEFVGEMKFNRVFGAGNHYSSGPDGEKEFQQCKASASAARAALPPVPAPKSYDLVTPARTAMNAWRDGKFDELFAMGVPDMRESVGGPETFAHLASLFAPITGKFVRIDGPFKYTMKDFTRVVTSSAVFEKGTVPLELEFKIVDGVPGMASFSLTLPEEMRLKPVPGDAEKLARQALDAILANKFSELVADADTALVQKIKTAPELASQVHDVVQKLGKVRTIKLSDQRECDQAQCLKYDIVTAKGPASATFTAKFAVSRWELDAFDIGPGS